MDGKVAIITGAGRGIGRSIAVAYGREGALVCCAARTNKEIQDTVREINRREGQALAVQTDVTNWDSVHRMVQATVDEFRRLDILVVNAGGSYDRRHVEDSDTADWLRTLEVNLVGAYYCAKAAIPHLKQSGAGKIITIGSGIGHNGYPGTSADACSKAALWMLTRVMAQELWEHNISVNELIPGPVVTERTREMYVESEDSVFNIPSEWVKSPEDIVPLALFLATQPDKGPTGQSFSLMRRDA